MAEPRFFRCGNDPYSSAVADESYNPCPACREISKEEYLRDAGYVFNAEMELAQTNFRRKIEAAING